MDMYRERGRERRRVIRRCFFTYAAMRDNEANPRKGASFMKDIVIKEIINCTVDNIVVYT